VCKQGGRGPRVGATHFLPDPEQLGAGLMCPPDPVAWMQESPIAPYAELFRAHHAVTRDKFFDQACACRASQGICLPGSPWATTPLCYICVCTLLRSFTAGAVRGARMRPGRQLATKPCVHT
jgi:hypothetical protein